MGAPCKMSQDGNGPSASSSPPQSLSNSLPNLPNRPSTNSRLMTRSALASFTSPSLTTSSASKPSSPYNTRHNFNVERIYEFEAPQFYDFTKQSDPERGHLDEHWFDARKRTPSSPDFHFIARTSTSTSTYRPKSASGKLYNKGNFSGSSGGLSFMNTPIGRGQNFTIPSSVGPPSSASFKPRAALKKSATTENVTNSILMNTSDSSDPPSTIIKSVQNRFKEFGSDERKIISGFMSTPLLVIKTPNGLHYSPSSSSASKKDHHHLPRSPLQKVTTKKSKLGLYPASSSSFFVNETSSMENSVKSNETSLIEESIKEPPISSTDCSIPNTSILNEITSIPVSVTISNTSATSSETFHASINARITEDREKIEAHAALQAKRLQKIKAGPSTLPIKSTKPLTIPKGFHFKSDERAQLKKSLANQKNNLAPKIAPPTKITRPSIVHKFTPTIPKSPLFASKLRAATKATATTVSGNVDENVDSINTKNELRKRLEFRPNTREFQPQAIRSQINKANK